MEVCNAFIAYKKLMVLMSLIHNAVKMVQSIRRLGHSFPAHFLIGSYNKKAVLSQRLLHNVPDIDRLEKISLGIFFSCRKF